MPVQFAQPISQFVNPNSVEISQILRDRYLRSFAAQDELQQKLLELQTAPFAGDVAARNALIADTNKKLGEFAERGDYENLTVPIANVARETSKKFTPLAQNYAAYEKAKQVEQERMLRGDITRTQYDRWLERSKYTYDQASGDYSAYTGVQFDDMGNAIQSSFYTHTPIAAAVDVDKEILTVLNTLEREKTGGSVTSGYDEQGGLIFYVQKEGQIVERVSPERVDAAVREVLNRSNVRSYLDQEAEFQIFDLNDRELNVLLGQKAQSRNQSIRGLAADAMRGSTGDKRSALKEIMDVENTSKYLTYGRNIVGPGSRYGGGVTRRFEADFTEAVYGSAPTAAPPAPVNPSTNGQPLSVPSAFYDPNEKAITQEKLDQTLKENRQRATTSVGLIRNKYGKVFDHLMGLAGITEHQKERLAGKDPQAYSNIMLQVGRRLQEMTNEQLIEAASKSADPSGALVYLQAQRAQFNKHQAIIKAGEDFNATVRNDVGLTPDKLIDGALAMYATRYQESGTGTKRPMAVDDVPKVLDAQTFVNTVYRMRKALGVDDSLIRREITSSLLKHYGLNANEAAELLNETTRRLKENGSIGIDQTLATFYEQVREERSELFNEELGTYSNATLTMKEFVNAPGDRSKNFADSEAMRKAAVGSTTFGMNIAGLTDMQGVTIPNSKITRLAFTTVLQNGAAIPAVSLVLEDSKTPVIVRYEEIFTNEEFKNYILGPKTADILGEAYTYTYNNPASSAKGAPAVITRNFPDGVLIAKLYPVVGGNNSFAGYGKVETEFNGQKAEMSFDEFLYYYNNME